MNRRGFTLVELLVFAALFLTATITFGYFLSIGKDSVNSALRLNQAVCLAQSKMEGLRSVSFASLPSYNGNSFANGKGKILVTPVLADLLKVELRFEWDPKKVPIKMHTLRSKY